MNTFKTRSSARKNVMTVIITFLCLFALAFLGLKIAVVTWLFFETVLLLTFAFCMFLVARSHWEMEFRGCDLMLYSTGNRQSYYVEDLTRADLMIKQTEKQKAKNTCDLQIRNAPFVICDVKDHSGMWTYIQENIPG